jgi:molybdopterin molybdotransferase
VRRVADELLSVAAAREAVLTRVGATLPPEPVPLDDALGRVLAQSAVAPDDVPGFDNSAMDGFAVRAADTAGAGEGTTVRLRLANESRAGAPAGGELRGGEAFRISTGAAMPAGADAVVRLEDAREAGDTIELGAAVAAGRDVRRAGEDIRAGAEVLRPGTVLGPAELGVLASVGVARPACTSRPRVAVVCTGDELLAPDEPMRPGGVRNSNAFTVPALARAAGARVASVERVGDDRVATQRVLGSAVAEADVAVVCGGVSVGEHDHVKAALAALGCEQVFWGVALRPGRPTWFGVTPQGGLAFGLPGNPVSAFVTFVLFVRPALRALAGAADRRFTTTATLTASHPRLPRRDQAVRCSLELGEEGWLATPTGPQGSHVLTSMLGADALAIVEAGPEPVAAGSRVAVELLR